MVKTSFQYIKDIIIFSFLILVSEYKKDLKPKPDDFVSLKKLKVPVVLIFILLIFYIEIFSKSATRTASTGTICSGSLYTTLQRTDSGNVIVHQYKTDSTSKAFASTRHLGFRNDGNCCWTIFNKSK